MEGEGGGIREPLPLSRLLVFKKIDTNLISIEADDFQTFD